MGATSGAVNAGAGAARAVLPPPPRAFIPPAPLGHTIVSRRYLADAGPTGSGRVAKHNGRSQKEEEEEEEEEGDERNATNNNMQQTRQRARNTACSRNNNNFYYCYYYEKKKTHTGQQQQQQQQHRGNSDSLTHPYAAKSPNAAALVTWPVPLLSGNAAPPCPPPPVPSPRRYITIGSRSIDTAAASAASVTIIGRAGQRARKRAKQSEASTLAALLITLMYCTSHGCVGKLAYWKLYLQKEIFVETDGRTDGRTNGVCARGRARARVCGPGQRSRGPACV